MVNVLVFILAPGACNQLIVLDNESVHVQEAI